MAIICDNASSNDKMIDDLAVRLVEYPGAANRTRCFTHILNLVVKSVMQQFDLPKKRWDITDERTHELYKLAGDIEEEELETQAKQEYSEDTEEGDPYDNGEGWVDEREQMAEDDVNDLEESVQPIWVVLTKVSEWVSKCCTVLANKLTRLIRFANLPSQSRIQVRLHFLSGFVFWRTSRSRNR